MSNLENQRKVYSKFELAKKSTINDSFEQNDYQEYKTQIPFSKIDRNKILINLGGYYNDTLLK